jgi:hypothetical protein
MIDNLLNLLRVHSIGDCLNECILPFSGFVQNLLKQSHLVWETRCQRQRQCSYPTLLNENVEVLPVVDIEKIGYS